MQQVETEFSKRRSKKEPEAKRLGSIQTVAQKLDLGVRTTYTMIKDGRLPLKPIHLSKRCVRYDMKALERWISSLVEGAA